MARVQVGDRDRLDGAGEGEAEDAGVEVELGVEGALDAFGPAEAVLLALEREVGDGQALLLERLDHQLGLVGRHDLVLEPLEEDHRAVEAVDEVERRAAPPDEGARAVDAVVDVDDAPQVVEPLPVLPTVAGAAAVVYVEHGDAAARPVLDGEVECAGGGARRPTVALHQERRPLSGRAGEVAVRRRGGERGGRPGAARTPLIAVNGVSIVSRRPPAVSRSARWEVPRWV